MDLFFQTYGKMYDVSSLQLQILDETYEFTKQDLLEIIENPSIDDTITIFKIICRAATTFECMKHGNKKFRGKEKKALVWHMCRRAIIEISGENSEVLELFDRFFDDFIENVIDFAKNNKLVQNLKKRTPCC